VAINLESQLRDRIVFLWLNPAVKVLQTIYTIKLIFTYFTQSIILMENGKAATYEGLKLASNLYLSKRAITSFIWRHSGGSRAAQASFHQEI
jgi:hypothetical protein